MTKLRRTGCIALIWACSTAGLWAQEIGVSVPAQVGLVGAVRPGTWAPLLIKIENPSSQFRSVHCEWILDDIDGDEVHARRTINLNPQRTERAWLYARPPMNSGSRSRSVWRVLVSDAETGEILAVDSVSPRDWIDPTDRVIGVMGGLGVGLRPFAFDYTQHEKCHFITGLAPSDLPDRWYGYSILQALIWTPLGGSPDAAPGPSQAAIREWVRRGGHLVIILDTIGDPWADSGLRDLLPVTKEQTVSVSDLRPPRWLGEPVRRPRGERYRLEATVFRPDPDVAVLHTDNQDRPLVIAQQFGLGRVTLIGVNVADPQMARYGIPNSYTSIIGTAKGNRLWGTVFGWRMPVLTQAVIDGEIKQRRMGPPHNRRRIPLGKVMNHMPPISEMRRSATAALLAAIFVFGVYWLLAGPIGFAVLKRRDQLRHSWLIFTTVVLAFTVVTWAGAYVIRPSKSLAAHFSIVDMDAKTGLVHTHSWLSLFDSEHGRVEVALDSSGSKSGRDLLGAVALVSKADDTGFLDPQRYLIAADNPSSARFPWRATAKPLEVDHLATYIEGVGGPNDEWGMPQAAFESSTGWPKGELWHALPGTLTNVLFVYCPGDGEEPWVWKVPDWAPDTNMKLDGQQSGQPLAKRQVVRDEMVWRGHLGDLISRKAARVLEEDEDAPNPSRVTLAKDTRVKVIDMLSFYSSLPPPDFLNTDFLGPATYERAIGRQLDITHLLDLRRLIVIGHLEVSPLPVTLTADGKAVPSIGWAVVRWICPLDSGQE